MVRKTIFRISHFKWTQFNQLQGFSRNTQSNPNQKPAEPFSVHQAWLRVLTLDCLVCCKLAYRFTVNTCL